MNMRERIARALVTANGADFDKTNPVIRDCALRDAGAVLAAMRTPTQEMMFAGGDREREIEIEKPASFRAQLVWQAMIDAAGAA